jgi:hypothetical protein
MLCINGTSNHIHFFIGMKASCCLFELLREKKNIICVYQRKEIFKI